MIDWFFVASVAIFCAFERSRPVFKSLHFFVSISHPILFGLFLFFCWFEYIFLLSIASRRCSIIFRISSVIHFFFLFLCVHCMFLMHTFVRTFLNSNYNCSTTLYVLLVVTASSLFTSCWTSSLVSKFFLNPVFVLFCLLFLFLLIY